MQVRFDTKPDAMRFRDDLIEIGHISPRLYKGHREYVVEFVIPPEDYELNKISPDEKSGETP